MKHEPIFHVYQDSDRFFAALPEFVNLQESEVVWLDELELVIQNLYEKLKHQRFVNVPETERCWYDFIDLVVQNTREQIKRSTVETVDRWGRKTIREKNQNG